MNLSHHYLRRLSIGLTMGAIVALGLLVYRPVFGDFPRDLITQPIDESKLVTAFHKHAAGGELAKRSRLSPRLFPTPPHASSVKAFS